MEGIDCRRCLIHMPGCSTDRTARMDLYALGSDARGRHIHERHKSRCYQYHHGFGIGSALAGGLLGRFGFMGVGVRSFLDTRLIWPYN